jgi:serine protease Do
MLPSLESFDENPMSFFIDQTSRVFCLRFNRRNEVRFALDFVRRKVSENENDCEFVFPRLRFGLVLKYVAAVLVGFVINLSLTACVAEEANQSTQTDDQPRTATSLPAEVLSEYQRSIVCIASVPKYLYRRLLPIDKENPTPTRIENFSHESLQIQASRFCTGLVWGQSQTVIAPYSALGDPTQHTYFVWHNGYVAQGTLKPVQAEVIVGEPYTNLAALQIADPAFFERLRPLNSASCDDTSKGQVCVRLSCSSNYPADGSVSVDDGIVMNLHRSIQDSSRLDRMENGVIEKSSIYAHGGTFQTNHADYFDMAGAIFASATGKLVGVSVDRNESNQLALNGSFALPTDRVFVRIADAIVTGKQPQFGFLGIQPGHVEESLQRKNLRGVAIDNLIQGMPGEQAGLKVGDVITHVGGRPLEARDALFRELAAFAPGRQVDLTVRRVRGGDIVFADTSVSLSKRYVATFRPAFTLQGEEKWNGAIVDYATAIPLDLLFAYYSRYSSFVPQSVVIVDVDPGSVAWDAGLRIGHRIIAVNGQSIDKPADFAQAIAGKNGMITLDIHDLQGRSKSINIMNDVKR